MGGGGGRQLDVTPTWAVAAVCAIIVLISILLEKVIHKFAKVFEEKRKVALLEALEKIKAELMVLGFISLLLTFGQNYISKMCIPMKYANTMLPCLPPEKRGHGGGGEGGGAGYSTEHGAGPQKEEGGEGEPAATGHRRRLLLYERRFLSADAGGPGCKEVLHLICYNFNFVTSHKAFLIFAMAQWCRKYNLFI